MERIEGTIFLTQSWLAWLMLSRKMLTPARIISRRRSGVSEAGPRVAMILVLRRMVLMKKGWLKKCHAAVRPS